LQPAIYTQTVCNNRNGQKQQLLLLLPSDELHPETDEASFKLSSRSVRATAQRVLAESDSWTVFQTFVFEYK
jgi:hypothetical protein